MPRPQMQNPSTAWLRPRRPLVAALVVVATSLALLFALAVTLGFTAA